MAEAASPGRSTEQKGAGDARTGALFRHSRTQRKPRSGGKRGFPNPFGEREGGGRALLAESLT